MALSLGTLARLRARLDAGVPLADALPEGVTEEAWPDQQREALVSFADALEHGDVSLLAEYKAAYEKAYAEHAGIETELSIDDQRDEQRVAAPALVAQPHPETTGPDETSFLSAAALGSLEPVPFSPQAPGLSPQPLEPMAPHESVGETGFIDASVLGEAVMPFGPEGASPERSPAASVDETAFVAAVAVEEALPFSGEAVPPASASQASVEAHPQVGGTAHVQVDDGKVPDAPLPFASTPRGQQDLGGLSLQQLAALEVEVAHAVGRVPQVLEHFGVNLQQYRAAKARFAQLSETQPALSEAFQAEKAAYSAWRARRA